MKDFCLFTNNPVLYQISKVSFVSNDYSLVWLDLIHKSTQNTIWCHMANLHIYGMTRCQVLNKTTKKLNFIIYIPIIDWTTKQNKTQKI